MLPAACRRRTDCLPHSAACCRSLLGGIGMGSVSDYCVQHLPCPVLVVKQGPEAEKQQQQT
jgi:hypothetical protein